jgi:hypothetical protein
MFVAPRKTFPFKKNWICQDLPFKVIDNSGPVCELETFFQNKLLIDKTLIDENFYPLTSDNEYVYSHYGRIDLKEFEVKKTSINKILKHFKDNKDVMDSLKKISMDSYTSSGNSKCVTLEQYNSYKNTDFKPASLEKFGNPIFNRAPRYYPPIDKEFTHEKFMQTESYPAPIGVRSDDFSLPSEQELILIEMLNQLFSSKDFVECPPEFIHEYKLTIIPNNHKCLWCGELMDLKNLNQSYSSKEHSVNFCHRDPNGGTNSKNVYIGHCSCNREQGGYSEEERIRQVVRLCKTNPEHMKMLLSLL